MIIKSSNVRLEAPSRRRHASAPAQDAGARAPSRVRLLEDDGEVYALEVTCACGETTVVQLTYGDSSAAVPPGPEPPVEPQSAPQDPPEDDTPDPDPPPPEDA